MIEFLSKLFDTSDFPERWHCGNWTTGHGLLHIISDILIFGAYFSIPVALTYFLIRKRSELAFARIYLLFAIFILSCGFTHLIDATIFWQPWYRLSGMMKLTTALVSWATVIALLRIAPTAIKLPGLAAANNELKERIVSEQAARRLAADNQQKINLILNSTAEGIYGIGPDGHCTFANRAAAELFGYDDPEDLVDKVMHDLIHHSHPDGSPYPAEECPLNKAARSGEKVQCDSEVFWRKDKTSFPVEYWAYPYLEDGKHSGAVITFFDISSRKETERELVAARERAENQRHAADLANRQKSQFLANMSHEIRTPMNAILGFGELMEELVENSKAKEYLSVIRSSGNSLLELINDLLDLSKIEAGKIELTEEPIDLADTIRSVVTLVSPGAQEKQLDISLSLAPDLPTYIVADRLRLRQILLNLITNAVKYTDRGGVSVNVTGEVAEKGPEFLDLTVAVSDTGRGIPEDELEMIFAPFHQVNVPADEVSTGSGLGLNITRNLAHLMGGTVSAKSKLGSGSLFTLLLPSLRVPGPDMLEEKPIATENSVDFDSIPPSRILVVDDNTQNLELLSEIFENTHHEIIEATDGKSAVESAKSQAPDIILMDIRMPRMSGREALEILKAEPDLKDIPVIAVTASSLTDTEKTLRNEFDGYLRKPFSLSSLHRQISRKLGKTEQDAPAEFTRDQGIAETEEGSNPTWDAIDQLPASTLETIKEELKRLENSVWKQVSLTLSTQGSVKLAQCLQDLADHHDIPPLAEYSKDIRHSAETFAISRLEKLIAKFPLIIANFEQEGDDDRTE